VQQDRPELHWLVPNSADGMHRRSHARTQMHAARACCCVRGWWSRWTKDSEPKLPRSVRESRSSSIFCQKISYWELAATLPRCPLMPELAIGSLYIAATYGVARRMTRISSHTTVPFFFLESSHQLVKLFKRFGWLLLQL